MYELFATCPAIQRFVHTHASEARRLIPVQVLRYSALFAGIIYGFSHQRTISAQSAAAHAQAEYQHKLDLIQKAKLEWAKKTLPPQSKTASGDGMWHAIDNFLLVVVGLEGED
jgi:F-type H+-transporting ATP synthase subunit e